MDTLSSNPLVGYLTSAYAIGASVLGFSAGQMDIAIQVLTAISLLVGIIVGLLTAAVQVQRLLRDRDNYRSR